MHDLNILFIRQPKTQEELTAMYDLRWRILRRPWNQPRGSERDEFEQQAIPFIALLDKKIVGTARFHKINEHVGQIRYLAVEENYQRKGIGSKLLEAIHLTAKNQFFRYLILNARSTAINFFKKHGYSIIGDGPTLFNVIRHKKMIISFSRSDIRMRLIVDNLKKTLLL
ncbi:MAG: GNAT family N-acetyltransferase [Candidatus Helarchaeota archaeon]